MTREKKLQFIFQVRCFQLEKWRAGYCFDPIIQRGYSRAVLKYSRARKAWRAVRGWK